MISKEAKQLVEDIFLQVRNPRVHNDVKEDPEAHLLSLLKQIKAEISGERKVWAMLYSTVEKASYQSSTKEARKQLDQPAAH